MRFGRSLLENKASAGPSPAILRPSKPLEHVHRELEKLAPKPQHLKNSARRSADARQGFSVFTTTAREQEIHKLSSKLYQDRQIAIVIPAAITTVIVIIMLITKLLLRLLLLIILMIIIAFLSSVWPAYFSSSSQSRMATLLHHHHLLRPPHKKMLGLPGIVRRC